MIALTFVGSLNAYAAISLNSTRVLFDGSNKEANVIVRNSNSDILVQSWIESNTPGDSGELPFAITPPLAKMQANGQQLLRVLYAGGTGSMPTDKESVLWLNVQEVPQQTDSENALQLAVRQRIKVFFRPVGLPGSAAQAPAELQWSMENEGEAQVLKVVNPSAFNVSMPNIELGAVGEARRISSAAMIGPGETMTFPAKSHPAETRLGFSVINDYGGSEAYQAQLTGTTAAHASLVPRVNQ